MNKVLESAWNQLAKALRLDKAGKTSIQYREMRKAFYAGCSTVVSVLEEVGTEGFPEEDALGIIQSMKDESEAFKEELRLKVEFIRRNN